MKHMQKQKVEKIPTAFCIIYLEVVNEEVILFSKAQVNKKKL